MSAIYTYMVAFDVTSGNNSWLTLNQYIKDSKDFIAYWNYIPFTYMVKASLSATDIATKLQSVIPGQNFIVVEINHLNMNGILPRAAWDWIHADHRHPQPTVNLDELLKALLPPPS